MGKKVSLLDFSYTRPAKGHLHSFQKISGTGKALHHSHAQPGPCVLHERPFRHVHGGIGPGLESGIPGVPVFPRLRERGKEKNRLRAVHGPARQTFGALPPENLQAAETVRPHIRPGTGHG